MRFLFATLQHVESDFYGRVGRELEARGHEVVHLAYSRRATARLRSQGTEAYCLPELMQEVGAGSSWREEESRIVASYPIASLHDVYRTDLPCRDNPDEEYCVERTIKHFLAIERLLERVRPDLVIPEVGNESIRTVSHLVGSARGATTLFLMYTIFDDPLRLYAGTMDGPIVAPVEVRSLEGAEEAELDDFIARYTARNRPIREYRRVPISLEHAGQGMRHFAVRAVWDRDNEYLRPAAWLVRDVREKLRGRLARTLYARRPPERPYVYFPLQVSDDYKILRLRPHCVNQEAIVEQVAAALPPGTDLVVKEHPMAIGRTSLGTLRRLARIPNVHLAEPHASSLELLREAVGVATISSSVGLEALLYDVPVLTLGTPFYSGFGVTVDVEDLRDIAHAVPELLRFSPDRERTRRFVHAAMRRCYPGAPVLVDRSDRNALRLADTLHRAAEGQLDLAVSTRSALGAA